MGRPLHSEWMRRALAVASSFPEDVPVGAVLYGPDGVELAAAGNEREATGDPTAHAEILVLRDRKSTRLNSSHANTSYAVFCLKKQTKSPIGASRRCIPCRTGGRWPHVRGTLLSWRRSSPR